ncbi:hemin-degrading family protein [Lelliottia amnigena]|nr:hemin-degrading family protein [Lelliottia amnigena]
MPPITRTLPHGGDILTRFTVADNPALDLKAADVALNSASPDAEKVDAEWRAMTDVHQFFSLLKRHSLSRQQAFRLVGDDLACKVDNRALARLLDAAHQTGNEIMVFVGNRGLRANIYRRSGKVVPMKGWLNIFNPAFTLHLLEETIAETWVTRKPTADGTSPAWSCSPQTGRRLRNFMASVPKANQNKRSGARRSTP